MSKVQPYVKEGESLVRNPDYAAIIRKAIDTYLDTKHISATNVFLSKETDQLISRDRTKRLLSDPSLAGYLKVDGVFIRDTRITDPYLTLEVHKQICALLSRDKGNPDYIGTRREGGSGVASGIAKCGKCLDEAKIPGVNMVSRNRPSPAYVCPHRRTRGCNNSLLRIRLDRAIVMFLERKRLPDDFKIRDEELSEWQRRCKEMFQSIVIRPTEVEFIRHNGERHVIPRTMKSANTLGAWPDEESVLRACGVASV